MPLWGLFGEGLLHGNLMPSVLFDEGFSTNRRQQGLVTNSVLFGGSLVLYVTNETLCERVHKNGPGALPRVAHSGS